LGRTGIRVSRLCFGALTIGPLQANLPLKEGAALIRKALELGVNFIDTAELYRTYPYINLALRGWPGEVVVASKSYAYTRRGMAQSLEAARRGLDRDVVDIFLLHEQESMLTIRGHWEAVEYLLEAKEKGVVRAVGISTHCVSGVTAAARLPEMDVIHPLVNVAGVGIVGRGVREMLAAIVEAAACGKGIYAMKALGGGNLIGRREEAFRFILSVPQITSVAVGMSCPEEVEYNVQLFSGRPVPEELKERTRLRRRTLHIENWCRGCGECVKRCPAGALSLVSGRAFVNEELCLLCGYCGSVCPDFCIKVI